MSAAVTGKRKRKWDVAADGASAPAPAVSDVAAEPAPIGAALPVLSGGASAPRLPVRLPTEPEPEKTPTGRLVHRIDINSSPARFYITKGDFQKKVANDTGVTVSTRGMYLQEGGILPIGEEPLYLQLEAEDEEAMEKAKAAIKEAMENIKEPQVNECRLYANFPPASEMRAKGKVLGPRGQFVKYIEQKYGVRVQLKGDRVCGEENEEHLHLLLAAPNAEQMAAGKKACANLLDHVRFEFARLYHKERQNGPPGHGPPGRGHGPPGHGPPGHGPPGYGPPGHGPPAGLGMAGQPPAPGGYPPQAQQAADPNAPPPPGYPPAFGGPGGGMQMPPPQPQEPPPPPPPGPPPGPPPDQPPPPPPGQPPVKRQRT